MKYAKTIPGVDDDAYVTVADTEEQGAALERDGWLPLEEPAGFPDAEYFKYHYEVSESGDRIVLTYIVPPAKPRTFSRYRLKLAIASRGLLQEFTQMLSDIEILPGYPALEAFNDALTLDEDNKGFQDAVALAKDRLGLTDEDVESILSQSEAVG